MEKYRPHDFDWILLLLPQMFSIWIINMGNQLEFNQIIMLNHNNCKISQKNIPFTGLPHPLRTIQNFWKIVKTQPRLNSTQIKATQS